MADALLGEAAAVSDDVAILLLRYDGMRVRPVRAGWVVWRVPERGDARPQVQCSARCVLGYAAEADTVLLVCRSWSPTRWCTRRARSGWS